MKALRIHFASLLFLALLSQGSRLSAHFTVPIVDVPVNLTGAATSSLAIWSSTKVTIAAGSWISINMPAGTILPLPPTINNCYCMMMKYTEYCATCTTQTYTFSAQEVTVTSGIVSGNTILFQTPNVSGSAPMNIGKFYIRFKTNFGFYNPVTSGVTTLNLVDPEGDSLASNGYFIANASTTDVSVIPLTGTVTMGTLTGSASVGALVMASTDGTSGFHPLSWAGPETGTASGALNYARSVTSNAYTASTDYNGSYRMLVPAGTYTIQAFASRVTLTAAGAYILENVSSTSISSVTVGSSPTAKNLYVPVFTP